MKARCTEISVRTIQKIDSVPCFGFHLFIEKGHRLNA